MRKKLPLAMALLTTLTGFSSPSSADYYVRIPLPKFGNSISAGTPSRFSLHENGITVTCNGAAAGETGVVNGKTYTAYNDTTFPSLVATKNDLLLGAACTSGVTNMDYALFGYTTNPDISHWDTKDVTSMVGTFGNTTVFNRPIGKWNTGKVVMMAGTFSNSNAFNQPIGEWDTSSARSMQSMFAAAREFNQPIGDWDTSGVVIMQGMFNYALSFNQPIDRWNTANVQTMNGMFLDSREFNQPISQWNVESVTDMTGMFSNAAKFNQPLAGWNTANLRHMNYMFARTTNFNQNLSCWNVTQIATKPTSFDALSALAPNTAFHPRWNAAPNTGC